MHTIEINKIVGAVLGALLLALGLGFLTELITGHPEEGEPVYLVAAPDAPDVPDAVVEEPAEAEDTSDIEAVVETVVEAVEEASEAIEEAIADAGSTSSPLVAAIASADLAKGEKLFKKCKACHGTKQGAKHKIGPNLWDVVGNPKGHHDDFKYSSGLTGLGGDWDYAALDAFLADPKGMVPGTKMAFPGLKKEADRAAVIAYLRAASDSPAPLE
jgi:cytochrome c